MHSKPDIVPLFKCSPNSFRFRSMIMEIRRPDSRRLIRLKLETEREVSQWKNVLKEYCTEWDIHSRFQIGKELGKGGFGAVREVLDTKTGHKLAVKEMSTKAMLNVSNLIELQIMSQIDHPNLLVAYGIARMNDKLLVFMPFMNQGSIRHVMQKYENIPENVARTIMRRILRGIECLHEKGIAHRDVKPENIMVDYDEFRVGSGLDVKVGDFGIADKVPAEMFLGNQTAGTYRYYAPEMVSGERFGLPADVWACGIVLLEMLTGESLLGAEEVNEAIVHGFHQEKFPTLSPEASNLIASLMNQDQYSRISITQALKHPWLSKNPDCSSCDLRAFFSRKIQQNKM